MNLLMLKDEKQLAEFHHHSFDIHNKGALLFKHSTRCSLSDVALNRLERAWNIPDKILPVYYLDLLAHRHLSSEIAIKYGIPHESPQILIIKNGKCIYTASHSGIIFKDIQKFIS